MTILWRRGKESGQCSGPGLGKPPAIILCNPKYPHNVGQVVRLAACYGIGQVWLTGDRVKIMDTVERLPREERMRDYDAVTLFVSDYPIDQFRGTPCEFVACEFTDHAENLCLFEHVRPGVYVFGPEDGHVPKGLRVKCYRFVKIPTLHCLNLATAVATVLYDRHAKITDPLGAGDDRRTDLPSVADAIG